MRRFHLMEIHDQPWCPKAIRDGLTDYIQFNHQVFGTYKPLIPPLLKALKKNQSISIVDLCSGSGGPWRHLARELEEPLGHSISVLLTDKFPNVKAFQEIHGKIEPHIHFHTQSIDAMNLPSNIQGMRTLFGSFHHFKPEEAAFILQDAVEKQQSIGVFEVTERHLVMCGMALLGALLTFLTAPFVRPFKWPRLILTWLIPIIPLVYAIDGIVSCLRTYTATELRTLVKHVKNYESFDWKIGRTPSLFGLIHATYLIGYPKLKKPANVKPFGQNSLTDGSLGRWNQAGL